MSFCFSPNTDLNEAKQSLSFLLLSKEKVFPREKDNCFDVLTSTDRSKLLEKFLRKRYSLVGDVIEESGPIDLQDQHCQLELKTTRIKKVAATDLKLGKKKHVKAAVSTERIQEVSVSQLLLGLGRPGSLDLEGKSLYVECRKGATGAYQLIFSYSEEYKARVSSEVSVKKGEALQVAQVSRDLAEKSKTLGLPETLYKEVEGQDEISYELQIK